MNKDKNVDFYDKKIGSNRIEAWNDKKVLEEWLTAQMEYTSGDKLLRFDKDLPYGPDNCVICSGMSEIITKLKEKYGINFSRLRGDIIYFYGKDALCDEWNTTMKFLHWVILYDDEIPYKAMMRRIDKEKKYGPDNVYFQKGRKVKEKCYSDEERKIRRKIGQIKQNSGINFESRYNSLKYRGAIDPKVWPSIDFYKWAIKIYESDEFFPEMHFHKINEELPLSEDNVYLSWRKNGNKTHGMSFTKLYNKYYYFISTYKERIKENITFEDFIEYALEVKKYKIHQKMAVKPKGYEVVLSNVDFIDTEFLDDLNRIHTVFMEIPKDENDFTDFNQFMEWSIRKGYTSYKSFKKVGKGNYSPETCVWDIFDQISFNIHKKKITPMVERQKKEEYFYRKRANLKAYGGVSGGWEDYQTFKDWCQKNKVDRSCIFKRINNTLPFSPDNVTLVRKAA